MRMKMMMSAVLTHSPTGEHGIVKTQTSDLGATGMAMANPVETATDFGATARITATLKIVQNIAFKFADAARSLVPRTPPAPVPI